ncbi:hypothetical protein AMJ85_06365 [candidate division BRC1 bacterium SM23_51]|nr:MAG: hypothetical protein AMJ85_06365 [candidate division BRC1 bacterium SM23_51]
MAEQPLTRRRAIIWWGTLFVVSVLGTAFVMWRWYHGQRLWLGIPLYAALFVCASVPGMRVDPEKIRKSVGTGLRALVEPAPFWALAVVVIEILILVFLGLDWFWRTTLPLPAGIVAGYKWARQGEAPGAPAKDDKESPKAVDFWKT